MSNASLKDQLRAVASQLSINLEKNKQKPAQSTKSTPPKSKSAASTSKKINPKHQKSNKPIPAWLEDAHRGIALLKNHFPACFFSGDKVQPLKIGIKQDLINQLNANANLSPEDKACMIKSLSYYVNTVTYLKKVVASAIRLELDGNAAGEVSAQEAKYSLERLQAKQTKQKKPAKVSETR